jgi:hypothetical protein
VLAGTGRDQLLRVATKLYTELGYVETHDELKIGEATQASARAAFAGMISDEDERLVAAIREALAKVASAVDGAGSERVPSRPSPTLAALDGAEMVMRGEILAGHIDQLPNLLPSFVFLVTLPVTSNEEAVRLSRRMEELLVAADGEDAGDPRRPKR